MIVALDFDGTLVKHVYPEIGEEVPYAFFHLRRIQLNNPETKFILWTMRDCGTLEEAVDYCREHGLEFYGVNKNPGQCTWSSSPKAYAHVYIDDAALGCPLVKPEGKRPYADWTVIGPMLEDMCAKSKS